MDKTRKRIRAIVREGARKREGKEIKESVERIIKEREIKRVV